MFACGVLFTYQCMYQTKGAHAGAVPHVRAASAGKAGVRDKRFGLPPAAVTACRVWRVWLRWPQGA